MGTVLILVAILALVWLVWNAIIVMRGNNYHALVRQSVLAQIGAKATPYLENRQIIEQITNAFRRGDPASSTAMALAILIEQSEKEDDPDEDEYDAEDEEEDEDAEDEEEDEDIEDEDEEGEKKLARARALSKEESCWEKISRRGRNS